jgi:hypothetical protein
MAAAVTIVIGGISGCANNGTTPAASNSTAGQRTYSSQDLNRTGKRTTGEQLQAADPSVTAEGSNR